MKQENKNGKKLGNKGFSLVELIIVIAIMAILIGIVGAQVIPYLNRSREAKDNQILSSYITAAVSTVGFHPEVGIPITLSVSATNGNVSLSSGSATTEQAKFIATLQELTMKSTGAAIEFASERGKNIASLTIQIDEGKVTITPVAKTSGATAKGALPAIDSTY